MKNINIKKIFPKLRDKIKETQGATVIIVALVLTVLLGFAALAVDIGYNKVTRNELQNVADAAALAGARQLGYIYEECKKDPTCKQSDYVCNPGDIFPIVQQIALQNKAAGVSVNIVAGDGLTGDVIIGIWDGTNINPTFNVPRAVRVTTRRDNTTNGPITTFFARIFGTESMSLTATATAALTGQSTSGPGGLPIPFGISNAWFATGFNCNQPITFYPSNSPTSCAGWDVYNRYSNFNDSHLRDTITDLESGSYTSPEVTAGQTVFEFGGGTMSQQTFDAMLSLFNYARFLNDGVTDLDKDDATWTATVPVYDSADCSNPHGPILIVGFATVVIDNVVNAPSKLISGYVICNQFNPGSGGGSNTGTFGTIPNLVQ